MSLTKNIFFFDISSHNLTKMPKRIVALMRKVDVLDAIVAHEMVESAALYDSLANVVERLLDVRLSRPVDDSIRVDLRVQVLSLKKLMTSANLSVANNADVERFRQELGQRTFRVNVPETSIIGSNSSSTSSSGPPTLAATIPTTSSCLVVNAQDANGRKRRASLSTNELNESIECKIVKRGNEISFGFKSIRI